MSSASGLRPVDPDRRYFVEAASRTMQLLEYMAAQRRPLSLAELVDGLGWTKPMVYRLVRTLEVKGAIRKLGNDGFVLGLIVTRLGEATLDAMSFPHVAQPYLKRLHDLCDDPASVNLGILDGVEVVYAGHLEGGGNMSLRVDMGTRLPAYCTSMGHVLLAAQPDEDVEALFADTPLQARGPNTITSLSRLLERLTVVRDQGYEVTDEELTAGVRAAAAPVRDHEGEVVAAVNASVLTAYGSLETLQRKVAPLVVRTADEISEALAAAAAD